MLDQQSLLHNEFVRVLGGLANALVLVWMETEEQRTMALKMIFQLFFWLFSFQFLFCLNRCYLLGANIKRGGERRDIKKAIFLSLPFLFGSWNSLVCFFRKTDHFTQKVCTAKNLFAMHSKKRIV